MEQKLREYRALRRRKELLDSTKATLEDTKQKVLNFLTPKFLTEMDKEKKEEEVLLMDNEEPVAQQRPPIEYEEPEVGSEVSELETFEEDVKENSESWQYFIIKWIIYSVIWLTIWLFFLKQGFGAVYFAVSILVFICFNTSNRKKKPGEVSAYSVFNRNCESIDGTLKAEELQRQMMFGMGGIRLF